MVEPEITRVACQQRIVIDVNDQDLYRVWGNNLCILVIRAYKYAIIVCLEKQLLPGEACCGFRL